jgi:hypothetical protein
MAAEPFEMSKTSQERREMSYADPYATEVRSWIVESAEARRGSRKTVLSEIAHETGLHVRRITAHFYGQVRSPSAAEWEQAKRWRQQEIARRLRQIDADRAALLAERQRHE